MLFLKPFLVIFRLNLDLLYYIYYIIINNEKNFNNFFNKLCLLNVSAELMEKIDYQKNLSQLKTVLKV